MRVVVPTGCWLVKERRGARVDMKNILLVHTGGTLGMSGRRPDALKPGSFFRTVRERVPELTKLAHLEFEVFSNIDSCEMQPELWSQLAPAPGRSACPTSTGWWSPTAPTPWPRPPARCLSCSRACESRWCSPGRSGPLGEIRTDARLNLIDAVTSALHGPQEVTVCFDSHLYRGNRVRKVSIAEYDAFDSPNHPVLGVLGVEARFQPGLGRAGRFSWPSELDPRVFLLRVFPGLDPAIPLALLPRVKGLVLEAYGAGNFPSSRALGRSLTPLFAEAQQLGVPVLVVSQAPRNGVDLSLYESGTPARTQRGHQRRRHDGVGGGGEADARAGEPPG